MPLVHKDSGPETEWANCPEGDYQAVIADVIDLGWIEKFYEGQSQGLKPHVQLVYQLGGTDDDDNPVVRDDGQPWLVFGRKLMLSLDNRSGFYKEVSGILGKKKLDELIEGRAFDTDDLLGVNINAIVSHAVVKASKPGQSDKTFVNIQPIKPWPKKSGPEIQVRDYKQRYQTEKWEPPVHSAFGPKPNDGEAPPQPKPNVRPEPNPPVVPTEDELEISVGQMGQISSLAKAKLGGDGEPLKTFVFDGYGKKLALCSKGEGAEIIQKLRAMPDFDSEDDSDPFDDDEGLSADEIAAAAPVSRPRGNGKAASEAYASTTA